MAGYAQIQNGIVVCFTAAASRPDPALGVPGLDWIPVPDSPAGITGGWFYDGTTWAAPPPPPAQVAAGNVRNYGAALANGIAAAQNWQTVMGTLTAGQPLTAAQVTAFRQQATAWVQVLTFLGHLLDALEFQAGS